MPAKKLAFLLGDFGIDRTAATHAALLLATEAPLTVVLAAVSLGERLTPVLRTALLAGAAGTALVATQGGGEGSLVGDVLVVAASLAAAGFAVLARRTLAGRDLVTATAVQLLGALLIAAPLWAGTAIAGNSQIATADLGHLAAAVALTASVLPFLLKNAAITRVTATSASLVLTLIPVFGTAASVALLGESVGLVQIAGGGLVIAAAAVASR